MNVGLFGGTFDPPHLAHLAVAEAALSFGELDRVIWIPASIPPHRGAPSASIEHRLAMLELTTSEDDRFEVSDVELRRAGPSYTVDTLGLLKPRFDGDSMSLIIGGDSLRSFRTWRDPQRILEMVDLIVFDRDDAAFDDVDSRIMEAARVIPDTPLLNISSSDIRRRIRNGMSISELVPDSVEEYIRARRLYLTSD